MRYLIPILSFSVLAAAGCHSPSAVHPPAATATPPSPSVAKSMPAKPRPFQPLLITTAGTHDSVDGAWRITVSEAALDFSHAFSGGDGKSFSSTGWSTVSPEGWKAQPGWFIFLENPARAWAYDGDRQLLLQVETSVGVHHSGASYSRRYSCAVPAEVLARVSEPVRQRLQAKNP